MTIHRRPVSRSRWLAVVGAVVMLAGCLLPWYTFVGDAGSYAFAAFRGSGMLNFIAALATLALVTLPYAAGDRPVALDRWPSYAILAGVALLGIALWPWDFRDELSGFLPERAPGFWLTAIGALILARAAFDIAREPTYR
jgi:hypothetical protein